VPYTKMVNDLQSLSDQIQLVLNDSDEVGAPVKVTVQRRSRHWFGIAAVAGMFVALVLLGFSVIHGFTSDKAPRQVAPLSYPIFEVTSHVPHDATPSASRTTDLKAHIKQCNSAKENVAYISTQTWVSVDPPGTVIPFPTGGSIAFPGCRTVDAEIPVPQVVLDRTKSLAQELGIKSVVWRLAGQTTPTDKDYAVQVWQTPPFEILP
jgi:hypothetical protein